MEGDEVCRIGRPGVDLLPELCDVIVNRSREQVSGNSPDVVQQLFARHDLTAPLDQVLENLELARRQRQRPAVVRGNMSAEVDLDWAEFVSIQIRSQLRHAPQLCPDASHEFADAERLRDVIVRAQLQTSDFVRLMATSSQHDDRCQNAPPAQGTADVKAIHLGEHDVQQNHVWMFGQCLIKTVGAVFGDNNLEPFELAIVAKGDDHVAFIFNDEELRQDV